MLSKGTKEKVSFMFQDVGSSFIPKSDKNLQHHEVVLARRAQSQFSFRENLKSLPSNNKPDALIIQFFFCYKTLHVSGIFSVHHQEFSTVHSALVSSMQVFDDRFQAESFHPDSAWKRSSKTCMKITSAECTEENS